MTSVRLRRKTVLYRLPVDRQVVFVYGAVTSHGDVLAAVAETLLGLARRRVDNVGPVAVDQLLHRHGVVRCHVGQTVVRWSSRWLHDDLVDEDDASGRAAPYHFKRKIRRTTRVRK
ncbi:hypothetical protein PspLS_07818 [Pyricularia sp. CBS 133598]|nr:hypothetical protein PspLS_07818 [Pyricularia sp. CBS 133598]